MKRIAILTIVMLVMVFSTAQAGYKSAGLPQTISVSTTSAVNTVPFTSPTVAIYCDSPVWYKFGNTSGVTVSTASGDYIPAGSLYVIAVTGKYIAVISTASDTVRITELR